ncbi:hypothetical protein GC207_11555 [bacterium]|nr:hypothetical protein [bacterium]
MENIEENQTTPGSTTSDDDVPPEWTTWCRRGNHSPTTKKKALMRCLQGGQVRGYFSDLPLRPDLDHGHSMYPSVEHLVDPTNHDETVVEARIINYMKSHLSEQEFWQVVEHLFAVGVKKGRIKLPYGKRLPKNWSPARHYKKDGALN